MLNILSLYCAPLKIFINGLDRFNIITSSTYFSCVASHYGVQHRTYWHISTVYLCAVTSCKYLLLSPRSIYHLHFESKSPKCFFYGAQSKKVQFSISNFQHHRSTWFTAPERYTSNFSID